ncbi:dihydrodipicolinate synthase family protein [Amycolatopsis suaedae]|uniref:Dihydrodipicolinate synthase family protein n=1 Tax=Amycolatopsis suaedae TaxID=2510978 RepID=A0A4V2EL79_9PSEU|nr:dihydrodipicolinate synthase family protein [Amycolatopsis suaedae]RZQ60625.1 dihydrodipicolinate synthase family protein [Amycolatopsis suaedae]
MQELPTSFTALRDRLAGVVAIPVTPFDAGGGIDEPAHRKIVTRIVDGGVGVVTPNGNTGEFYALSAPEARTALELTADAVGGRATIVAGVGHAVPDAVAAARHARDHGAEAIMVHQPVHPYVSLDGWVDYHHRIAEAVPELGVVLYVRSTRVDGAALARLGALAPNVIAVKYAVPDPVRFATVAGDAGRDRFVWIAGLAELSAPGYFAVGATGFTSGLVNVAPALPAELLAALRAGDTAAATRVWDLIRPFEQLRADGDSENNVSVVKEALAQLGICRRDVRPPSRVLGESGRAGVGALLATWGLL